EEFTYLRARTDRPAKATLINAQQAASYYDAEKSKRACPTLDAYLADIVDILRGEIGELIRLGCTYIQVDAPQYAVLVDPQMREDRTIVLGLVTTKKATLESKDELVRRIRAAQAVVPLERLALSPQCGFASAMEGNLLSPADQEAKLRLVAETAREVWGES